MKTIILKLLTLFVLFLSGCSGNEQQIRVKFDGSYPEKRWSIKELNPDMLSDWSGSGFITFEFNSSTTHRFDLNIYDAGGVRSLEIVPFQNVWVRASIPLIHFQKMNTEGMDQASIWKTPRPGYWIGFTGAVGSINNIDSLGVAMNMPIGSPTLEIRNFRLTTTAEDTILTNKPLVDEFGQWISDEWQGKAKTIDDLKTAWSEEEKSLRTDDSGISKYGGFQDIRVKATGFFHVEKIDGKWWFVDPEGYLFFSNGSCCINSQSDLARIKGREYIFASIPPDNDPAADRHSEKRDRINSFYSWNLFRRLGPDWYQKWINLSAFRMNSWGINTIGNWSDPNLGESHQKAYVATLDGWGIESGKMGMPDVYAPGYRAMVDSAAALQCRPKKDDPYLIGYFIGNELPWPGRETELAQVILDGDETPIKKALKEYLSDGDTPEKRKKFAYDSYSEFIEIVSSAIKKYDPNHLNLGLRFGDTPATEIILASKSYFDVFSINHYGYEAPLDEIEEIYRQTGLPVIIGEFHFGVPGRGLAPGLAQTKNMEERAVAYQYYVENAASHPALIGAHWFQWIDQPSTGRFDGENYNIGLVDVTDQPYPDMIKATRETFAKLPDIHSGKVPPTR
ncbi:MAG: hypothetical protein IPN67_13685 [Bacteroidales bacterium]|nr:hypothetical protein [Bacteroidales bacterium]